MTVDTGSPISILTWSTAKQILESSREVKFVQAEHLNLPAQFVAYNKHPIVILGALKAGTRSAGWEVQEATFSVTKRRKQCILWLDLQNRMGISTTQ